MSFSQSLGAKKVEQAIVEQMARELAIKIRSISNPERIILFGSAADGRFVEGSDLDLILIFADQHALVSGRKAIRSAGSLTKLVPIDLVFVTHDHFESKKNLGGICFIAEHEGKEL